MPAYQYEALDAQGKKKKGMIAADSLRDARKRLQSKTLFPVSLTEGGRAEASDRLAIEINPSVLKWGKLLQN